MANPLTYANSDEYVLVNPSDPKVGHLVYDAPMVDAETKQFIRDPETGKIKVYRMVIWGTKGLTQAQVEALITQKNATLVTRINNLDSTLTNFLDADDTTLDQLSELITEIKSNRANIASLVTDIGKLIDPVSHLPIEATTASVGVVQLATAQDVKDGTANKVVDAKELINFAQTLPAVNGITDVSSGDNSNQLVVSRIGGSKTLTIDNVEHASNADTATSANSVAWDNVSGKPSSFTPASHTHNYAGSSSAGGAASTTLKLETYKEGSTTETYGAQYLIFAQWAGSELYLKCTGYNVCVNKATTASSVAWNNVSGKPSSYTPSSHTHDDRYYTESEIDTKLSDKANSSHTHDDRYYTESEINTKLSGKSDTTHNHNSAYLGISAKAESAKSADSVAWANVSGKPSTYTPSSHTHNYAGSSNAGGAASSTLKLETYKQGSTTETYGANYPIFAQWVDGSNVALKCTGYTVHVDKATTADSANAVAWSKVSGRPDIWIG